MAAFFNKSAKYLLYSLLLYSSYALYLQLLQLHTMSLTSYHLYTILLFMSSKLLCVTLMDLDKLYCTTFRLTKNRVCFLCISFTTNVKQTRYVHVKPLKSVTSLYLAQNTLCCCFIHFFSC